MRCDDSKRLYERNESRDTPQKLLCPRRKLERPRDEMNGAEESPRYSRRNNLHDLELILRRDVAAVKHGHAQRAGVYLVFDMHHFDEGMEDKADEGERSGDE